MRASRAAALTRETGPEVSRLTTALPAATVVTPEALSKSPKRLWRRAVGRPSANAVSRRRVRTAGQHMHVVRHDVSLLYPTLLLLGQPVKRFSKQPPTTSGITSFQPGPLSRSVTPQATTLPQATGHRPSSLTAPFG